MKIVINGKFLLARLEGMPRVGREITAAIDKILTEPQYRSLSVEIAVPRGGAKEARYANIPVREVGRFQGPVWEQIEFPFHLGADYSLNFTATAPIIKRRGCVVVHDAQFKSTAASHGLKSYLLYNVVTTIVARRYQDIVTVSDYARREINQYKVTDRDDIFVIHNGADHSVSSEVDFAILERFHLQADQFALTNSYIHAHKNVRTVLKAFESQPRERKLVLFGTSTKADYEAAGIPVPDNAIFVGRVSNGELNALFRSARMFLFPSTTEGFGLPPLEAMAQGTPTICSNAGAMPEVCSGGALFVDEPRSPDAWSSAIDSLWTDEDQRTHLRLTGPVIASKYKWETSARHYLDFIMRRRGLTA